MLLSYKPAQGASVIDMVLNTYVSLDMLPKFVQDNTITDLNAVASGFETYIIDTDYISDEFLSDQIRRESMQFTTGNIFVPNASFENEPYILSELGEILTTENNLYLIYE